MLNKDTKQIVFIAALLGSMLAIGIIGSLQITCGNEHSEADKGQEQKYISCKAIFRPFPQEVAKNKAEDSGYYQYPDSIDSVSSILISLFWKLITDPINVITAIIAGFTIGLYRIGRDTARKELRAYLGIPDPGVQRIGVVNHFQVQVTITNSGRTPARDVQKWMRCSLVRARESISFDRENFDPAKRSIAPDSKWNLRADFTDWTDEDLNETRHFRSAIYVWGEISYKDIYGASHTTEFRLRSHATRLEILLERLEGGGVRQHQMINGFDLEPETEGNDLK
ncbi:MAG: hypothetical protein HYU73_06035 [Betaproteobacteria bacterium]|nr:hypothetical protein [Betaproteobacteria bacterium]